MGRLDVAWRAWALEGRARSAERRALAALARIGGALFEARRSGASGAVSADAERALAQLERLRARTENLPAALEASLAHDRGDFARAGSKAMRWVVVGRGMLDRMALRDEARRARRETTEVERDLARLALEGSDASLRAGLDLGLVSELTAAREDSTAARAERERLLAPYAGEPLPRWLAIALREAQTLAGFLWLQLSKKVFLTAPAVAGLIGGWWVTSRFTDSWRESGIFGSKERISTETLERLKFWVPILAAALCSYAAFVVDGKLERRYARGPDARGKDPPPA